GRQGSRGRGVRQGHRGCPFEHGWNISTRLGRVLKPKFPLGWGWGGNQHPRGTKSRASADGETCHSKSATSADCFDRSSIFARNFMDERHVTGEAMPSYLPRKFGPRFSRNAWHPSWASSVSSSKLMVTA